MPEKTKVDYDIIQRIIVEHLQKTINYAILLFNDEHTEIVEYKITKKDDHIQLSVERLAKNDDILKQTSYNESDKLIQIMFFDEYFNKITTYNTPKTFFGYGDIFNVKLKFEHFENKEN